MIPPPPPPLDFKLPSSRCDGDSNTARKEPISSAKQKQDEREQPNQPNNDLRSKLLDEIGRGKSLAHVKPNDRKNSKKEQIKKTFGESSLGSAISEAINIRRPIDDSDSDDGDDSNTDWSDEYWSNGNLS